MSKNNQDNNLGKRVATENIDNIFTTQIQQAPLQIESGTFVENIQALQGKGWYTLELLTQLALSYNQHDTVIAFESSASINDKISNLNKKIQALKAVAPQLFERFKNVMKQNTSIHNKTTQINEAIIEEYEWCPDLASFTSVPNEEEISLEQAQTTMQMYNKLPLVANPNLSPRERQDAILHFKGNNAILGLYNSTSAIEGIGKQILTFLDSDINNMIIFLMKQAFTGLLWF